MSSNNLNDHFNQQEKRVDDAVVQLNEMALKYGVQFDFVKIFKILSPNMDERDSAMRTIVLNNCMEAPEIKAQIAIVLNHTNQYFDELQQGLSRQNLPSFSGFGRGSDASRRLPDNSSSQGSAPKFSRK